MAVSKTTLLVEGAFSELAEELAQYIDTISKNDPESGVYADVKATLETIREAEAEESGNQTGLQKQKDEVLKKIITKAAGLNNAPEREFTAAYNLLISLSSQSPARDSFLARICQYLSGKPVATSSQYGPALAIAALTTIFNVLPMTSEARYHVFLAILKVVRLTSSAQAFEALIPQLEDNIPNWLSAWQLDEEDARNLHVTVADVAESMGDDKSLYRHLLSALETITPDTASEADSQQLAKRTLVAGLSIPSITDFTALTASDAIQALRKSDANLFELLEIFSSDDYSSYTDFLETNSLESVGIAESAAEVLSNKIRQLTLAGIAASSSSRSVPYSAIASALQIPSEDVEMWVIDTIRAGLVEGKLSQLKQEFLVQRATYRIFGEKQWIEIQGRLSVWRRSLESVLAVVKAERERFEKEGVVANDDANNRFYAWDGEQRSGQNYGGRGRGGRRGGGDRGGGGHRNDRNNDRNTDRHDRTDQQSQAQSREIDIGAE